MTFLIAHKRFRRLKGRLREKTKGYYALLRVSFGHLDGLLRTLIGKRWRTLFIDPRRRKRKHGSQNPMPNEPIGRLFPKSTSHQLKGRNFCLLSTLSPCDWQTILWLSANETCLGRLEHLATNWKRLGGNATCLTARELRGKPMTFGYHEANVRFNGIFKYR